MLKKLKTLIKITRIFKKLKWSDERISSAMMHDLFSNILQYYQEQIGKEFNKKLSRRIDLVQAILDTWDD